MIKYNIKYMLNDNSPGVADCNNSRSSGLGDVPSPATNTR